MRERGGGREGAGERGEGSKFALIINGSCGSQTHTFSQIFPLDTLAHFLQSWQASQAIHTVHTSRVTAAQVWGSSLASASGFREPSVRVCSERGRAETERPAGASV